MSAACQTFMRGGPSTETVLAPCQQPDRRSCENSPAESCTQSMLTHGCSQVAAWCYAKASQLNSAGLTCLRQALLKGFIQQGQHLEQQAPLPVGST